MFRNGSVRADVTHVACPVIHGYKTSELIVDS